MSEKGKHQRKIYKSIRKPIAPPTIKHQDKKKQAEKEQGRENIRPQDWDLLEEEL